MSDQNFITDAPANHRILIVDDEEIVLVALRETLRREGYEVVTALNAVNALEVLERNQFSVIITDQQMPMPSTAESVPTPTAGAASGTVVLDVEQGGIVVPSFSGKSVRSSIELAQSSGLDLEVVGNGVAQDQTPPAGAHVVSGARIKVRFGR